MLRNISTMAIDNFCTPFDYGTSAALSNNLGRRPGHRKPAGNFGAKDQHMSLLPPTH
jgi:hypothetical protein